MVLLTQVIGVSTRQWGPYKTIYSTVLFGITSTLINHTLGDTCTCFAHSWSVFNPELELLLRVFLRQFFEMTRTRPRVLHVSFDDVRRTKAEQLKFLNRQVQPRHGTATVGSRSPRGSRRACVTKEPSMSRASRTDPPPPSFHPTK